MRVMTLNAAMQSLVSLDTSMIAFISIWHGETKLLDKYDLKYFKASELNTGKGQFAKFRDKPNGDLDAPFLREKRSFLTRFKLLRLMSSLPLTCSLASGQCLCCLTTIG